jgi:hypothetical protein
MSAAHFVLVIGLATFGAGWPEPLHEEPQPLTSDRFLIIPLRAHVLTAPDLELADCKLKDAEVTRIVGKLNTIWNKAGIHFGLESIIREPAAQRDRFRVLAELKAGEMEMTDFQLLIPKQSRLFDGLHAVFFHELPFNGGYVGDDCAIVQEGAQLKPVVGGSDEAMPRVLGFALGRALGLNPRREPETSLMALGTTGVALEADDAERARRVAKTIKGVMTFADARRAAEAAQAAGQADRAKRLRSWLAEIERAANRKDDSKSCGRTTRSTREHLIDGLIDLVGS